MSSIRNSPLPVRWLARQLNPSLVFMVSAMLVNAGNYYYNVFLGRYVGPEVFAETGLLVTLLLLLSFLGMTFQIVAAKYIVDISSEQLVMFRNNMTVLSMAAGLLCSVFLWVSASSLAVFFHLSTPWVIKAFACGIPFYFLLSVQRGFLQGQEKFIPLSISYQAEMLGRFAITLAFLFLFNDKAGLGVAIGIAASIFLAVLFTGKVRLTISVDTLKKMPVYVFHFFMFTALYEVVQMLINYFDILLVKHYFSSIMAGYYTSLSLIGRMIYFVTWMFVMLLLPAVVNRKKEGRPYQHLLIKYVLYISLVAAAAVLACYWFADLIVMLVFGEQYLFIGPFLWKYALATGLFAVSNIFTYYYLSLNNYRPMFITGVFALLEMVSMIVFHENFDQVIYIQVVFMGLSVVGQIIYHRLNKADHTESI